MLAAVGCAPPATRVGAPCTMPASFAPFDEPRPPAPAPAPADGLLDTAVAWYQAHGRSRERPGIGCPFAPSCSAYARAALHDHGPVLGLVLIFDRLFVREHVLAGDYYPPVCIAHTLRLDDRVP
ncbi:MAG TPA: membrane protein insertion efficiency factor YidD [Kofleriaceae bacterium]